MASRFDLPHILSVASDVGGRVTLLQRLKWLDGCRDTKLDGYWYKGNQSLFLIHLKGVAKVVNR